MFRDMMWTRDEGVALCRQIETISPQFGAHVALTGGLLYRDGLRKDCDILIYRIRQFERIDWAGIIPALQMIGLFVIQDYGWCKKATYNGKDVDLFDAEDSGEYGAYDDFVPVTV